VIFSERVATLNWLVDRLPHLTGLGPEQVEIMHGGRSDIEQQAIVEQFALEGSPVRVLVTGDIASEGVNLHRQCHQLVHFDLPWSLITLEQRNGRIDRYGQRHAPEIRSLILMPDNDEVRGDVTVLTKLLTKEHNAHLALGDAASIMGLHSVRDEEDAVLAALTERTQSDREAAFERVVPDAPAPDSFDLLTFLAGAGGLVPPEVVDPPTLFADDEAFIREALAEVFDDPVRELELREEKEHRLLSLVPPEDLRRRLDALPQSYLREQRITERLKLTSDRAVAEEMLARARRSKTSMWPEVGYLSGQHPILDWLVDKVLVRLGRNEAPIITCDVADPTFLLQGVYSNAAGEPTAVEWMAVDDLGDGRIPNVSAMVDLLAAAGVRHDMINPAAPIHADRLAQLEKLVPHAVEVGRSHMEYRRDDLLAELDERMRAHRQRLARWVQHRNAVIDEMAPGPRQQHERTQLGRHQRSAAEHIESLRTVGQPLVRVVAVLVGES
jgi:hypothetical protein